MNARSLLFEVLHAVNTGVVPDRLTFAVPPARRLGWLGPGGTTLTDEGRRQLTRLTPKGNHDA